ncbi:MAG: hypothetical protein DMF69_13835 [Acidobacteria bacterium]|nr:MAG: hypothetical protein DMF69_13835 [Acidobacteriota bacterium]
MNDVSSSISKFKRDRMRELPSVRTGAEGVINGKKIKSLQELVRELQNQLESITDSPYPLEDGLDFYEEVSRFEIQLIRQALKAADGHQGHAAKLLRLNNQTLNVMIKRYGLMS